MVLRIFLDKDDGCVFANAMCNFLAIAAKHVS